MKRHNDVTADAAEKTSETVHNNLMQTIGIYRCVGWNKKEGMVVDEIPAISPFCAAMEFYKKCPGIRGTVVVQEITQPMIFRVKQLKNSELTYRYSLKADSPETDKLVKDE